jgi:hypothetical protein
MCVANGFNGNISSIKEPAQSYAHLESSLSVSVMGINAKTREALPLPYGSNGRNPRNPQCAAPENSVRP